MLGLIGQVSVAGRGFEEKLSVKRDKSHVLFGGTKILQHTPDKVVSSGSFKFGYGEVLAYPLRLLIYVRLFL